MSSARRYQEDIRRIVGVTDDGKGLEDDLPRMRIGAGRGIYQIGTEEVKSGSGSEEDDGSEDGSGGEDPIMPDEGDGNANEDGNGDGDNNTDPDQTDPSDDVIDPENPENPRPVDDDTFGGGWGTGGPKGFVDCETNQCVELVEVGGFVPPEGWDDPDNGPIDPLWEKGFYWANAQNDTILGRTPAEYCLLKGLGGVTGWTGDSAFPACSLSSNVKLMRYATSDPFFQDPPPPPEFWPSDNCIQLAPNSEGNWAASSRDPDVTAKYSEPKSTLELCTPSGETVDVYQRVGGGHVYFNRDQGIWAASDSTGRVRSFGSSSTLDQEIAR